MPLSNKQKRRLHQAAKLLGPEFTEESRRMVQFNVGGFYSAADKSATQLGFVCVMAFYEQQLEKRGKQLSRTPGYWAGELAKATDNGDSLRFRCRRLAELLGWTEDSITKFISGKHMSNGAVTDLDSASIYWLRKTVNAVQAMLNRNYSQQAVKDAAADENFTDENNERTNNQRNNQ